MIRYVHIVMLNSSKSIVEYLLIMLDGVKKILNTIGVVERNSKKNCPILLKKML